MRLVRGRLTIESLVVGLVIVVFLFSLSACSDSGGGSGGDDGKTETGSIAFSLKLQNDIAAANAQFRAPAAIDCQLHGIVEIEAYVNDETGSEIARGGPWSCEQHSGTIEGVSPGENREVFVTAAGETTFMGKSKPCKVEAGISTDAGNIQLLIGSPSPPTNNDDMQTNEDEAVVIGVLSNDQPYDYFNTAGKYYGTIAPETLMISTAPLHGLAEGNADGTVTYTPTENYHGNDSFAYTVEDKSGTSSDATLVRLTVNPVNDPPQAIPVSIRGSIRVPEDNPVTIPVTDLGTDVDGDPLQVSAATQGGNGEVIRSADGASVTYNPDPNFNGADAFGYTVSDGFLTASGTVELDVTPVNDAPQADDKTASTLEDRPVTITVLDRDVDVDGDPLIVSGVTQGSNGTVTINGTSVIYAPLENFNGPDSFNYTVSDGALTDRGTVTLNVTPVNDCPVAEANLDTYETFNNTYLTSPDSILDNDTDVDNDELSAVLEIDAQNGSLVLNPDGSFTYSPNPGFAGEDTFSYTANDESCSSSPASVTISVVATGEELWISDGTPEGTGILKDINPGLEGSSPGSLTNVDGTLFFTAYDGTNGRELWKSDGTEAGTVMVADINTVDGVASSSSPYNLTAVNNTLFFAANNGINGRELWKSDGTEEGTEMVADINTVDGVASSSNPYNLTAVNNTLFFVANDGINGRELWRSEGDSESTEMVENIAEDVDGVVTSSSPSYLTAMGEWLFFSAADNDGENVSNGRELWKSNGMPAGTQMVLDINEGSEGSAPSHLTVVNTVVNDILFFAANEGDGEPGRELWKSDGEPDGTNIVEDINVLPPGDSNPQNLTNVNGMLFFTAVDGTTGRELWVSYETPGTPAVTVMVENINTEVVNDEDQSSDPRYLMNVNGTLFFTANDGKTGRELWKSDGDFDSATMVADIASGGGSSNPEDLTKMNGTLFFFATDRKGVGLWKSDPTSGETEMVKIINPDPDDYYSDPAFLTEVNGRLFFSVGGAQ